MKNSTYSYEYHLSFIVTHHERDLRILAEKLLNIPNLKLSHISKVGEERQPNPKYGTHKHSRCIFEFDKRWQKAMLDKTLAETMGFFVDSLYTYKSLLQDIAETGGHLDFAVGWHVDSPVGESFHLKLIQRLAELKISFGINLYVSDAENERQNKSKKLVEGQLRDLLHKYDPSKIINKDDPLKELEFDPYQDIFDTFPYIIKAGATQDELVNELKEELEYFNRTNTPHLPKSSKDYEGIGKELMNIKWESGIS